MFSRFPPLRKRAIARLLNVSIIIALLASLGLLIKRHYAENDKSPTIGRSARISIKGIDLSKSPQTLLLAIQNGCEYCKDSARFYRRLVQGLSGRTDIRIVALFPGSLADGQWYLNSLGITVSEAAQASLLALGIKNVPTLVLVNRDGVVSEVWIGKLPPKKEAEVMKRLAMQDTRPTSDWTINERGVQRRLDNHEEIILVDLRERTEYAQGHFPGAKNIPFDELNARAGNELPRNTTIVLSSNDDVVADSSYTVLSRQSFPHVLILNQASSTP